MQTIRFASTVGGWKQHATLFVCGPDLLRPQTFYRWAVTVWDNHGENTTAESSFETSLSSKEWKADWMRTPAPMCSTKKGSAHSRRPRCFVARLLLALHPAVRGYMPPAWEFTA